MVRAAARLVPAAQRGDWEREWLAEIWHRWQFLFYAGVWNRRESWALVRNCLGLFPDAVWHFALQDPVQDKLRAWARSPWTCLGGLATLLVALALLTGGLPATRQLLFSNAPGTNNRLLYIWLHPAVGGGDKELPPDVAPAWNSHSKLLERVAGFHISRQPLSAPSTSPTHPLVINTEPALFDVLRTRVALGSIPSDAGVVLDQRTWKQVFHADKNVLGSKVRVGKDTYSIAGILPANFYFLTRRPKIFVVTRYLSDHVDGVARARAGASPGQIDGELVRIAEDVTYYFFHGQLRMSFVEEALWTPVRLFLIAAVATAFLCFWAVHVRLRQVRIAFSPAHRKAATRRALFFSAKVALALILAFAAGLEWARSQSAILFGARDPAAGPFLLWLYILAAMGVFFWAVADQRARCRVCLRLLCFPVRIGCPGCLLLDWSGTELLCTQGHGVLHVPH
ncbi:MAG: ABC transporter permease, partial [Acidobacteriaceae bacterium]|nr:ABC transporter permease [Acidobacteriaceae bacterium]